RLLHQRCLKHRPGRLGQRWKRQPARLLPLSGAAIRLLSAFTFPRYGQFAATLAVFSMLALAGCRDSTPDKSQAPAQSKLHLGFEGLSPAGGFEPALPAFRFQFPKDGGSHPSYGSEWWYYTGHLSSAGSSGSPEYGFELTFFRVGLTSHPGRRTSR